MQANTVESSTLASVAYDANRELLQIEFREGSIYQYFGVPAEVNNALMSADSKGRYFNKFIRSRYGYSPLSRQTSL